VAFTIFLSKNFHKKSDHEPQKAKKYIKN